MVEQFVFSVFFLALFTFNGSFCMRLLCKQPLPNTKSFFAGFIIDGIYFELVHLFLPLTIYTLIPLVLLFAYEVVFQFVKNRNVVKNIIFKPTPSSVFIALCFFVFFITYTVLYSVMNTSLIAYDTYSYHASIVKWYNSYRIIPGLASLYGRLGMNSLYLFVAAGIDVGIFDKCSAFILPCVFITATFVYFIHQFFTKESGAKFYSIIMILWILFCSYKFPNLYYDNPSLALGAIFLLDLYKILLKEDDFSLQSVFELCLLAAGSFGIKQMGAFNVLISFIVLGIYCCNNFSNIKDTAKNVVFCLFIPFILFAAYAATNIIQTGYPLFPLQIAKLNLPWTVPYEVRQRVLDDILYWARAPGQDYMKAKGNISFWFRPWCINFMGSKAFWLLAAGCLAWLYVFIKKINIKVCLCLFSILAVNLIYWFISAPDVRFGSSLFFEFFAVPVCIVATKKNYSKLLSVVLIMLMLSEYNLNILSHILENKKNIRLCTIERIKTFPCEKYLVPNNQEIPLYINVPLVEERTGDAELPCSNYRPADNLMLFEPGNLQSGFYFKTE